MLDAMMNAPVGDDVFEDDPSVNKLQDKAAQLFGMEDAIFCPSGTMTNQIAIRLHTQPGDEVICDSNSHIYNFEGGGIAINAQASVRLVNGDKGRISVDQIKKNLNPDDIHYPITSLVSLENTINRAGGVYYTLEQINTISKFCKDNTLSLHMDGARFFNAITETGDKPEDYAHALESISICLSKGLGCPVGSLLLGPKAFIKKARRIRKFMGGGMRQAGFLAAAAIYALDNNIDRLKEDHEKARVLENCLNSLSYIGKVEEVFSNIVIFELENEEFQSQFEGHLKQNNISFAFIGPGRIRFVTHKDISTSMMERVIEILTSFNPR
jgi:threonine aldolase